MDRHRATLMAGSVIMLVANVRTTSRRHRVRLVDPDQRIPHASWLCCCPLLVVSQLTHKISGRDMTNATTLYRLYILTTRAHAQGRAPMQMGSFPLLTSMVKMPSYENRFENTTFFFPIDFLGAASLDCCEGAERCCCGRAGALAPGAERDTLRFFSVCR